MKILLIADGNSEWTFNFLSLFQSSPIKMELWPVYRLGESYRYRYIRQNVKLHLSSEHTYCYFDSNKHSFIKKVLFLVHLLKDINRISNIGNYDIINVQYVDPHYIRAFRFFPKIVRRMVLSYWGSDLMREDEKSLYSIRWIVNNCRGCTFDNIDLENMHKRMYPGSVKRDVMMLPLPILDVIDGIGEETTGKLVKIDEGHIINRSKTSICIGYCGRRQQQHLAVLEQLEKLEEKRKENIVLLLPITYSVDKTDSYIGELKNRIRSCGIESLVFETHLTDKELARLRVCTDIMINAQTTDAFSGSMCEVLYAGGLLINAKWLHYGELDRYPIEYIEFDDFSELPEVIENALETGHERGKNLNKDIIKSLRSVGECMTMWRQYFVAPEKQ